MVLRNVLVVKNLEELYWEGWAVRVVLRAGKSPEGISCGEL